MGDIKDFARDALQTAQADIAKARNALPLAAGILALVHLLTVHPYIQTGREIAAIEPVMKAQETLLAGLAPDTVALQATAEEAGNDVKALLDRTTQDMIARFTRLRELVGRAMDGEAPAGLPDDELLSPDGDGGRMQQMPRLNMPQQMQQMPMMNMPAPNMPMMNMQQMAAPPAGGGKLASILAAIAAKAPAANDRLNDFARADIVGAAYARADTEWRDRLQPRYIAALDKATASLRDAAAKAAGVSPDAAQRLNAAVEELTKQSAAIAAVEIRADSTLDGALGTEWWRTVEGKGAFADAVTESVRNRMRAIAQTAQSPADALRDAQRLQQELQSKLLKDQQALEAQFARHREQLASLSGTSGVIPVDLASFIGLFPLVIGIVLGALLLRAAQARRQAAIAADAFARAAPDDRETREWLVQRALGGNPAGSSATVLAIGIVALLWIALAGWHVAAAPGPQPLPPWLSSNIAAALIGGATLWDLRSVRRLAARLKG